MCHAWTSLVLVPDFVSKVQHVTAYTFVCLRTKHAKGNRSRVHAIVEAECRMLFPLSTRSYLPSTPRCSP
jgi:hypothetical protein